MSLTVMIIAKNEAPVIGKAIDSVKPVADEILIADTGSSDDTPAIARARGATVFHIEWNDDFSAARNFLLERAAGDWVMGMDADEELLPASLSAVRNAINDPTVFAWSVTLQNLADPARPYLFTEMHALRLARRAPEARFVGRIHEHPEPPIHELAKARNQRIAHSHIILRHTGFITSLKTAKLQRAAHLLQLELQDCPGQLYYMIELGRTMLQLGDTNGTQVLADAARIVWERRDDERPPLPSVALLLEFIMLGAQNGMIQQPIGDNEALALAEKWFPTSAPLLWMRANRHFAREEFPKAANCLEQLLHLGRSGLYDRSINFDPRILGPDALLNLGACYLQMKDLDRAEHYLLQALHDPATAEPARRNLQLLAQLRKGNP